LYRARVWKYRIIFQKNKNVKILKIDTRWGVYKWL
jgi:mRNA-degrading endonuclease RelE of RelBE toxin-antitoxin system